MHAGPVCRSSATISSEGEAIEMPGEERQAVFTPRVHASVFVAEGARIYGDVEIRDNAGVWFNAVILGTPARRARELTEQETGGNAIAIQIYLDLIPRYRNQVIRGFDGRNSTLSRRFPL
jgi:carbonic anhydrase/acetyltransferase-like protein (isoleucine patch superfamily)